MSEPCFAKQSLIIRQICPSLGRADKVVGEGCLPTTYVENMQSCNAHVLALLTMECERERWMCDALSCEHGAAELDQLLSGRSARVE